MPSYRRGRGWRRPLGSLLIAAAVRDAGRLRSSGVVQKLLEEFVEHYPGVTGSLLMHSAGDGTMILWLKGGFAYALYGYSSLDDLRAAAESALNAVVIAPPCSSNGLSTTSLRALRTTRAGRTGPAPRRSVIGDPVMAGAAGSA